MKKKLSIVTLLTIVMTMCFGMTAFASPKTMPDGTVFDAEYYAKTYPDVSSAIGTDENALYQHYVMAGKAEGRHPVAPAQTTTSTTTASSSNLDNTLVSIQNKLSTGTVAPLISDMNSKIVNKFNADENIDDYIAPMLEVLARNGYKYLVREGDDSITYTHTSFMFNGTTTMKDTGTLREHIIYVSNTNHKAKDDNRMIKLSISKYLKDHSDSIGSCKKNDIEIFMYYGAPYNEEWYTLVREIPVN